MLSNIDKIIDSNLDDAIKMLKELVSFPSVLDEYKENSVAPFGNANKDALEYLLNRAKKDGFVTKNVDNYAGHIEFGTGNDILGILAHLDVVPVNKEEWTSDPFKLDIRDGKMFGRGSVDDKGPLVASYYAMKILKDLGFKPNIRVRLIAGCDEESGSRCMHHYLSKEEKPTLGFSPDADFPGIYGEKGMISYDIVGIADDIISEFVCGDRYNVVPSLAKMKLKIDLKKEYMEFLSKTGYDGEIDEDTYIMRGVASHAMCPENGINACYRMFEFLNKYTNSKLASFMDEYFINDTKGEKIGYYIYDPDMKGLTSNLAVFMLENNNFRIGVNCRVPIDSQLDVVSSKATLAANKYGYKVNVLSTSKRHYVDPNSSLVKTLLKSYQETTGDYESKPITIGGGTYARELKNAIAFGALLPGREDVCHIKDEYMYIEDFKIAMKIYIKSIYELSK